ncbi:maleylpyruvate isomerase N-terminal domain-containing protein [Amycolatopsis sp. cmx-4-61]|uniref:maleylpyruvate isomerase N-terminal domain-containing protein n=1 Tax=Amycolatopsis sp. cmx-4-61 TaxID=2790937 RepID=UPI00397D6513
MTEDFPRARGTAADVDLLRRGWAHWAEIGASLTEAERQQATRLPGWPVGTLYAHVARSVDVLAAALDTAKSDVDTACPDASAYFRSFHGAREQAARTVDQVARQAAGSPPAVWAAKLAEHGPPLLDRAAAATGAVDSPAGRIAVPDYLLTRLVEVTVHLLDLRAAVPGPGPEPEALHRVSDVLVGVAGPTAFVEAATGRTPFPVFPLLA